MNKIGPMVRQSLMGLFRLRPWLVPKLLTRGEKRLLSFLFGLFIIGFIWLLISSWVSGGGGEPVRGGTLVEGIVASSTHEIEQNLSRLTNVGLVSFGENHQIVPALAQEFQINEDGKKYTFVLRPGINPDDVLKKIKSQKKFDEFEVSIDGGKIIFNLKQPFAALLAQTTEPIFPYGPFQIAKSNKKEVVLRPRANFFGGQPYLEHIIIRLYSDQKKLEQALRKNEIMAAAAYNFSQSNKDFTIYNMSLPRFKYLFFNLSKPALQDKNLRGKLKNRQNIGKEVNLQLLTDDQEENLAESQKIKDDFEKLGAKITIISHDHTTLLQEDLPERNYDILLYTIDYGPDPDPYPFWHSSQTTSPNLNLSGFANAKADKLLEDGRTTMDAKARQDKYSEFWKIFDEEVPAIDLGQVVFKYQVSNVLKGIDLKEGTEATDRFQNVTKWYIKSKRK